MVLELKMCEISGYIYNVQGNPCSGVSFIISAPSRLPDDPQSDENIFCKPTVIEVISDVDGKFTFTLPQGMWFHIRNRELGFDHQYFTPYKDTEDFDNITGFYRREKHVPGDPLIIPQGDFFSESQ